MSIRTIDVRDAVIGALADAWPGATIYGEEIKQGFVEPCFFVKDFPVSHSHVMGRRYVRGHVLDVHYFPSSSEPNEEAHGVAEGLMEALELISIGTGHMRGTDMRYEMIDGVLHFFVTLNVHLIKQRLPVPLMESAIIKELIK